MGNYCNFAKTNIMNNTEKNVEFLNYRIKALEEKLKEKEDIIAKQELAAKLKLLDDLPNNFK